MTISRALLTTALACSLSGASMAAQDRPTNPQDRPAPSVQDRTGQDNQAPQMSRVSGQLVSVDAKAKMFTIRTAAGADIVFSYTDDTKVLGGDEGVNGLATQSGTDVIVNYTKKGQENVAAQIELQKSKA